MTARGNERAAFVTSTLPSLDARALEQLYARLEKPVFNVVYRWLWNSDEARDVTQEAFLKVWSARERIDVATAEPLVFRTALNLASNRLRSRRFWNLLGLGAAEEKESPAPSASEAIEAEQRRRQVRGAIERLPEKLKAVVVMCELSNLSYEQIAASLKIPVGTVGSRRAAAMEKLALSLGPLEDG